MEAKEHENGHDETRGVIGEDEGEVEPMGDVAEEEVKRVDKGGGAGVLRVV